MTMAKKVQIDDFATAVQDVLNAYDYAVQEATKEAVNETAAGALKVVRAKAKSYKWSNYPKTLKAFKEKKAGYNVTAYIYNESPGYQLAHLLEKGHKTQNPSKSAKAYPHFEAGQQYIDDYFEELLARVLGK